MLDQDFQTKTLGEDVPWGEKMARHYDRQVRMLFPVYEDFTSKAAHWISSKLPANARIFSLAPGTGREICLLAEQNPQWTFEGFDTSPDMLKIAAAKIESQGYANRVKLFCGSTDSPTTGTFDGVTAMLVIHFLEDVADGKALALGQLREKVMPGAPMVYADFLGAGIGNAHFDAEFSAMKAEAIAKAENPEECEMMYGKARELVKWCEPDRIIEIAKSSGWRLSERLYRWRCMGCLGFEAE